MYKEDYVYVEDKPKKAKNNSAIVLAVCVAASSVFGFAGGYVSDRMSYTQPASTETAAAMGQGTSTHTVIETSAVGTNKSLTDVVAMVKPSVVEITTEVVQTGYRFGQFISEGAGSGVVISDDGYIVTNHHVIDGASNVTVRLSDGSEYPATLVNSDAQTDLAVLKIEATGLTEATLGDSSQLMVGETTVAVGNPLGELGGTVTSGILSALDREISFDGQVMNLLQTDA
ncbi:MAG: S1C family serine protease, partial [Clostridiales bacterium]|nr:S1C family serine protease [Clostridiales bacterium]